MGKRIILSIEERLERTKASRALSPEDAAQRVIRIDKAPVSALLTESEKSMDILPPGSRAIGTYCAALCRSTSDSLRRGGKIPCEAAVGNSLANAIISLSFALATVPDRFGREQSRPPTYYDLKMTPGDYPDALIDVSFGKDGALDAANAEQYRRLKKELSQGFDFAKPLLAVNPEWKSRIVFDGNTLYENFQRFLQLYFDSPDRVRFAEDIGNMVDTFLYEHGVSAFSPGDDYGMIHYYIDRMKIRIERKIERGKNK